MNCGVRAPASVIVSSIWPVLNASGFIAGVIVRFSMTSALMKRASASATSSRSASDMWYIIDGTTTSSSCSASMTVTAVWTT
jgi:hypothetical protein